MNLGRKFILLICTIEKDLCIRHSNFGSIQLGFILGARKSSIQSIHTLLWFDEKVMICRKIQQEEVFFFLFFFLRIGSPRKTFIRTNLPYNVAVKGQVVMLYCSSDGFPEPVCQFYKDEQLVSVNGSGYIVQNFTAADEGEYTCKCSNVAGEDMANITLVLYGK